MKWIYASLIALSLSKVQAQPDNTNLVVNRINEERYITINGIAQWVTIKGDTTKPAILFLHGGPGSPLSPYADNIYKNWEQDFVLIQWDQRGTGRTFGANSPKELTSEYLQSNPLSLEQMVADGIELTAYVLKHLKREKIILFGTSWGSVLGLKMAHKQPGYFYGYIGHSQVINTVAANISAYKKVFQLAQTVKDSIAISLLQQIGKPPYDSAKTIGKFIRLIKKYQQLNTTPAPASWFITSPNYNNEKDNYYRSDGDDYSFVNYVGDKHLGVSSISTSINFFNDSMTFEIPIYIIQGAEDLQTPAAITQDYFNKIKAPAKEFLLLPKTEHGLNQSVVDTHYKVIIEHILPTIK